MAIPPVVIFSEFNVASGSPIGSRHLTTHSAYVKALSQLPDQFLDFGTVNLTHFKQTTVTKAVIARLGQYNGMNEAIFNLRFWIPDFSDFTEGTYYFNGFPSGSWIQNIHLTDASGRYVPTALPSGQNWWRAYPAVFDPNSVNFKEISQSGIDNQCTMFFYLSVTADTDVPNKTYGGNGGGFSYRMTFDTR